MSAPHFTPAPTVTVRRTVSTSMPCSAPVRSSRAPSTADRGAWPVGWAATGTPCSRPQRTAATTSSTWAACSTAAGCCGTLTIHGVRAASKPSSDGVTSWPVTAPRSACQVVSAVVVVDGPVERVVMRCSWTVGRSC